MKKTTYLWIYFWMLSLLIFVSCQNKVDNKAEQTKVEKAFLSYFNGISKFDYQAMRQVCTPDFVLIEDGIVWTVEDHINFLRSIKGNGSIVYTFKDVKINVDHSIAWVTHRNVAEANMGGNPVHFEWIESAIFKRINNDWKMALLHSSTVKTVK